MKFFPSALNVLYFFLGLQLCINSYAIRKDLQSFGISISSMAVKFFIVSILWQLKFFPALMFDMFSFRGMHRKPPMVLFNFLAMIISLLVPLTNKSEQGYLFCLFLLNSFVCFVDVNYDAVMVSRTRAETDDNRGMLQMSCFFSRSFGIMIGEVSGPLLWEKIGSGGVFGLTAGICFIASIISFFIVDDSVSLIENGNKSLPRRVCQLLLLVKQTLSEKVVSRLLGFKLIMSLLPSADLSMFFFLIDELQFSAKQMALLGLLSSTGRILTLFIYGMVKEFKIRIIYIAASIVCVMISILPIMMTIKLKRASDGEIVVSNSTVLLPNEFRLTQLFKLDDFSCAATWGVISDMANDLREMPMYIVASALCERTVEAGAYAAVLSSSNLLSGLQRFVESAIVNSLGIDHYRFGNLWILVLLCSLTNIIGILLSTTMVPAVSVREVINENTELKETQRWIRDWEANEDGFKHSPITFDDSKIIVSFEGGQKNKPSQQTSNGPNAKTVTM